MKVTSLYILLFLFLGTLRAQELERDFDSQKLEQLWGDESFDQSKKYEAVPYYGKDPQAGVSPDKVGANSQRNGERNTPDIRFGEVSASIMYILVILLLGTIIYGVLRNTLGGYGKKIQNDGIPELEEADIQKLDTKAMIAEAVSKGNYRLAIRLHYLDILKTLDQKNWIEWRVNKTNQDYVDELAKTKHAKAFGMLTYHFDYTWYGDFEIGRAGYEKLAPEYEQFNHKLGGR